MSGISTEFARYVTQNRDLAAVLEGSVYISPRLNKKDFKLARSEYDKKDKPEQFIPHIIGALLDIYLSNKDPILKPKALEAAKILAYENQIDNKIIEILWENTYFSYTMSNPSLRNTPTPPVPFTQSSKAQANTPTPPVPFTQSSKAQAKNRSLLPSARKPSSPTPAISRPSENETSNNSARLQAKPLEEPISPQEASPKTHENIRQILQSLADKSPEVLSIKNNENTSTLMNNGVPIVTVDIEQSGAIETITIANVLDTDANEALKGICNLIPNQSYSVDTCASLDAAKELIAIFGAKNLVFDCSNQSIQALRHELEDLRNSNLNYAELRFNNVHSSRPTMGS